MDYISRIGFADVTHGVRHQYSKFHARFTLLANGQGQPASNTTNERCPLKPEDDQVHREEFANMATNGVKGKGRRSIAQRLRSGANF